MKLHENPKRWNNKDKQRFLSKFLNQSLPKREKLKKLEPTDIATKLYSLRFSSFTYVSCFANISFVNLNVQFFSIIYFHVLNRQAFLSLKGNEGKK